MIKKILLVLSVICVLQGCVPIMAGATVGAVGGSILYDRRPIKVMMRDDDIAYAIEKKLFEVDNIRTKCHVAITSYNGVVLLVGQAPTQALKDQIATIARTVSSIKRLYNEITIGAPTSYLTRTSDAWITTKVKTKLLSVKHLKSGQFKILTEDGTVYMLGIVSRSQAQTAVNIVRRVGGVQKVVKVFEYNREPDALPKTDTSNGDQAMSSTMSSQTSQVATVAQTDEALYKQDGA